jgi:carbon-monoxide dehydrogenase medium subunit
VKAPAFAYVKAGSLPEVFDLLDSHGEAAEILAGGQSLLAALNLRLSAPELLVDITGLRDLRGIKLENGIVRIGALTTHSEVERSAVVREHLPLLAQAVPHVAHVAIRNAGTFGGSIAFADPAAEYPACALALQARLVIAHRQGERRVMAREFFKGLYETALQPGEVLVAAEFDRPAPGYRSVFLELARRRGDYAIIGLAAHGKVDGGRYSDVRLAFLGAGAAPVLAGTASAALEGERCGEKAVAAAQAALASDLDPPGDLYTAGPTKLHLARVLTARALAALASH